MHNICCLRVITVDAGCFDDFDLVGVECEFCSKDSVFTDIFNGIDKSIIDGDDADVCIADRFDSRLGFCIDSFK